MYTKLLQYICILWIKVKTHLTQPVEGFGARNAIFHKHTSHVTLMNQFSDLLKEIGHVMKNSAVTKHELNTEILKFSK
jgi:hypothetical protein